MKWLLEVKLNFSLKHASNLKMTAFTTFSEEGSHQVSEDQSVMEECLDASELTIKERSKEWYKKPAPHFRQKVFSDKGVSAVEKEQSSR